MSDGYVKQLGIYTPKEKYVMFTGRITTNHGTLGTLSRKFWGMFGNMCFLCLTLWFYIQRS